MQPTLFVIHWNAAELRERVAGLEDMGFVVADSEPQDGARAVRAIKESTPGALVIYLHRSPAHGRETAAALRGSASTQKLPIIFVGGHGHGLAKTRLHVPDALFVEDDALGTALAGLE